MTYRNFVTQNIQLVIQDRKLVFRFLCSVLSRIHDQKLILDCYFRYRNVSYHNNLDNFQKIEFSRQLYTSMLLKSEKIPSHKQRKKKNCEFITKSKRDSRHLFHWRHRSVFLKNEII